MLRPGRSTPSPFGRALLFVIVVATLAGCSGLEGATSDLRGRLEGIDIEETISELTDCDAISEAFIAAVRESADSVDEFAESTETSLPVSDIRGIVDDLAVSRFYEIAEQLGCARLQMELQLVDRLLEIDADTASGDAFLDEVLEQVQDQAP